MMSLELVSKDKKGTKIFMQKAKTPLGKLGYKTKNLTTIVEPVLKNARNDVNTELGSSVDKFSYEKMIQDVNDGPA